jgi:hypothetical protein
MHKLCNNNNNNNNVIKFCILTSLDDNPKANDKKVRGNMEKKHSHK